MAILNFYDSQLDIPNKILCTHALESKGLICKVLKKNFNANVQIIHSPSKSIRPIYNLCKLNSKQIIEIPLYDATNITNNAEIFNELSLLSR